MVRRPSCVPIVWLTCVVTTLILWFSAPVFALPLLGPEEFIQAGGVAINVPEYSAPSFVCWDNDALPDLIVGEGGGSDAGRIRVYLNQGTAQEPAFNGFFYAQSGGTAITETPGGCLGVFPRVVQWDGDGRKDLLLGLADGRIKLYKNIATDANPQFDAGTPLQVGPLGNKVDIDVGLRACPIVHDWNGDGLRDLVVGAYDGRIYLFINTGSDTAPDYAESASVHTSLGVELVVPFARSSPEMADLDDDGILDLVCGNTDGQVILYSNEGDDTNKIFTTGQCLYADGAEINVSGPARSRPFVCDWNADGLEDILLGAGDGYVRLFSGVLATDIEADHDVDMEDVSAFTDILLDDSFASAGELRRADVNQDGSIDGLDIAAYIAALFGTASP